MTIPSVSAIDARLGPRVADAKNRLIFHDPRAELPPVTIESLKGDVLRFTQVEEDGRTNVVMLSGRHTRSEEHTSELQSLMRISYAVFCLKKKTNKKKYKSEVE